ncbi:uncharacterized protein LOC124903061 [Homo sapiens]|uniref:cDNA FLJ38911 fis, clone NT2NE2007220 n=2 Tax=Homo sapiens TaxID=9606 RepID=Q8N8T0_HUMAN|nr:uncharacterized protein LOC124903061 [Homo sapiens]BAC04733.1 unnamed protein product [Homo sapiens]
MGTHPVGQTEGWMDGWTGWRPLPWGTHPAGWTEGRMDGWTGWRPLLWGTHPTGQTKDGWTAGQAGGPCHGHSPRGTDRRTDGRLDRLEAPSMGHSPRATDRRTDGRLDGPEAPAVDTHPAGQTEGRMDGWTGWRPLPWTLTPQDRQKDGWTAGQAGGPCRGRSPRSCWASVGSWEISTAVQCAGRAFVLSSQRPRLRLCCIWPPAGQAPSEEGLLRVCGSRRPSSVCDSHPPPTPAHFWEHLPGGFGGPSILP